MAITIPPPKTIKTPPNSIIDSSSPSKSASLLSLQVKNYFSFSYLAIKTNIKVIISWVRRTCEKSGITAVAWNSCLTRIGVTSPSDFQMANGSLTTRTVRVQVCQKPLLRKKTLIVMEKTKAFECSSKLTLKGPNSLKSLACGIPVELAIKATISLQL
uniref:Uncharacterized protein n=1 Tax=Glossina austeni TaxID=7395 RepID=A0A1A9VCH7_GLOAU